jgi:hypothetical protein
MPNLFKLFHPLPLLLILWCSSPSSPAQPPLSLQEMVAASGFIFSGKVINLQSARDDATGFIVTYATVAVQDAVRGVTGDHFIFKQYGGSYQGLNVFVADMSYFSVGEEVVAFLYPISALGLTSPLGVAEGKWAIERDPATGKKFVAANLLTAKMLEPYVEAAAITSKLVRRMEYASFIKLIREMAARDR